MKCPLPVLALLPALLAVTACGRQESVDELPTTEELAAAAKAEIAKTKPAPEAAQNRNYVNEARGFSIMMPEGWTRNDGASTAEGVVYEDAGAGADVRVFWSANADDKDLQQVVEAMNDGSEAIEGRFITDKEYRGTANDGEGNNVMVRLIKKADGSLVSATLVFPEMLNEQYATLARQTLDSLQVSQPAAAPPPAANAAAAANAAN